MKNLLSKKKKAALPSKSKPAPKPRPAGQLVSIGRASELLGVCLDTLREWDKAGTLVPVKTPDFSGKRKCRGLYIADARHLTSDGFAVNADVNGSLNIGRKVVPESSATRIGDRSLAARPVTVNPLKVQR